MPPIPPAAADGATRTTPLPLSWRADGPEGAPPLRRANRPKDSFVNSMTDTIRKAWRMNRTEDDS
jgi:hypothetical protein